MNSMKYLKRLNDHYERGLNHGMVGLNKPGLIYGQFRRVYDNGYKQGDALRKLRKSKTGLCRPV